MLLAWWRNPCGLPAFYVWCFILGDFKATTYYHSSAVFCHRHLTFNVRWDKNNKNKKKNLLRYTCAQAIIVTERNILFQCVCVWLWQTHQMCAYGASESTVRSRGQHESFSFCFFISGRHTSSSAYQAGRRWPNIKFQDAEHPVSIDGRMLCALANWVSRQVHDTTNMQRKKSRKNIPIFLLLYLRTNLVFLPCHHSHCIRMAARRLGVNWKFEPICHQWLPATENIFNGSICCDSCCWAALGQGCGLRARCHWHNFSPKTFAVIRSELETISHHITLYSVCIFTLRSLARYNSENRAPPTI